MGKCVLFIAARMGKVRGKHVVNSFLRKDFNSHSLSFTYCAMCQLNRAHFQSAVVLWAPAASPPAHISVCVTIANKKTTKLQPESEANRKRPTMTLIEENRRPLFQPCLFLSFFLFFHQPIIKQNTKRQLSLSPLSWFESH